MNWILRSQGKLLFLPPIRNNSNEGNAGRVKQPPKPPQFQFPRWTWLIFLGVLLLWSLLRLPDMMSSVSPSQPITIPYSVFYDQVLRDNVSTVTLQDASASGTFVAAVTWPENSSPLLSQGVSQGTSRSFNTTLLPIDDPQLAQTLRDHNVTIVSQIAEPNTILQFLLNWGPLLLFDVFLIWQTRRSQRQMGGVFGLAAPGPRIDARNRRSPLSTWPDRTRPNRAGRNCRLPQVNRTVHRARRAHPRGVQLIGPPGTGKTLLARAVGARPRALLQHRRSEFVEMFVGVGASRVRDLFNKAKAAAPAIVFIDEIDAVGRQRGAGLGGGNDEREQTLKQMLAE